MMFELTPTISQELDWGKDENYASFLLQGEKRQGQRRHWSTKITPKNKITLQLSWVNGPQIRNYKLTILKVCIELCSHEQTYRISAWKVTSVFHLPFLGLFTPFTICLPRSHQSYFKYLQSGITHGLPRKLILSSKVFVYKNILH